MLSALTAETSIECKSEEISGTRTSGRLHPISQGNVRTDDSSGMRPGFARRSTDVSSSPEIIARGRKIFLTKTRPPVGFVTCDRNSDWRRHFENLVRTQLFGEVSLRAGSRLKVWTPTTNSFVRIGLLLHRTSGSLSESMQRLIFHGVSRPNTEFGSSLSTAVVFYARRFLLRKMQALRRPVLPGSKRVRGRRSGLASRSVGEAGSEQIKLLECLIVTDSSLKIDAIELSRKIFG